MVYTWFRKNLQGDPIIWGVIFVLSLISIAIVYSAVGSLAYKQMVATEYYLFKHSLLMILALGCMWVAHKIDYRYYARLSRLGLWLSVPLLIYTYFNGININEASRWIMIPFTGQSFQPSDFAKLALIANLASMLAKRQDNIEDFKSSFIPVLIWSGVICGLIALSNFSTAVILFSTCLLLMFIGRVPVKYLFALLIVGSLFGTTALMVGQRFETTVSRVTNFMSEKKVSYQAEQAYIAIATGNVIGKGPGKSDQRNFLPHGYSDFIYALIIEEYGVVGGIFVLVLYLLLLYRGIVAVAKSKRPFGGLLSAGLTFSLVIQAMINMGVAVGLGPITGQPLPFLSMGGTSLLFTGISLGIILSVSRDNQLSEEKNIQKEEKELTELNAETAAAI